MGQRGGDRAVEMKEMDEINKKADIGNEKEEKKKEDR